MSPVDPQDLNAAQAFGALFEMDVLGLAQADPSTGRLLRVNRCFASMLDLPPSALIGRSFLEVTHPDDREANWAGFQRMVRGETGTFHFEKRLLRRDGTPRWVLMAVSLLRDERGQADRTVAAVMDLTDRKRVEEALARSEQRLQIALSTARLGLWQWTPSTGRMDCSDEVFRITGLDPLAAPDVNAFRRLVHPGDVDVIWEADEAARSGRPFHAEYRMLRPDGQERWVAHHAQVEHGVRGQPERMIGTLTDITGRKQVEEALRRARDELEVRVHERTEALALANTRLVNEVAERRATEAQVRELFGQLVSAEEEERRRLAREVHDSMGQHLTALTLGLKSVQGDAQLPGALRERLSRLLDAAGRLDRDLDRLAYRLRPAVLDDFGLDDALRELARTWTLDSGITVDVHTRGLLDIRFAEELETTVYRVVQEALTNVLKHASATCVSLIAERSDGELRAIIEDDGCGFVAQQPGFLPPHHVGLRSMTERAAQAGGHLLVESEPGRGTTVYLTIPLHRAR